MRIGLIIATEEELKSFLKLGTSIEEKTSRNRTYFRCLINGNEIFATKSGMGVIDSASATQFLITLHDVELVINFGVVGALDKSLKVSDLFVVERALNYQFDVSQIADVKPNQYLEFEDSFIPLNKNRVDEIKKLMPNIVGATCASGDRFIEDKKDKEYLNSLGCNICDMEIAAIARTCYLSGLECLSIKCISDTYDGDGRDFKENVEKSASLAFALLLKFIKNLKNM